MRLPIVRRAVGLSRDDCCVRVDERRRELERCRRRRSARRRGRPRAESGARRAPAWRARCRSCCSALLSGSAARAAPGPRRRARRRAAARGCPTVGSGGSEVSAGWSRCERPGERDRHPVGLARHAHARLGLDVEERLDPRRVGEVDACRASPGSACPRTAPRRARSRRGRTAAAGRRCRAACRSALATMPRHVVLDAQRRWRDDRARRTGAATSRGVGAVAAGAAADAAELEELPGACRCAAVQQRALHRHRAAERRRLAASRAARGRRRRASGCPPGSAGACPRRVAVRLSSPGAIAVQPDAAAEPHAPAAHPRRSRRRAGCRRASNVMRPLIASSECGSEKWRMRPSVIVALPENTGWRSGPSIVAVSSARPELRMSRKNPCRMPRFASPAACERDSLVVRGRPCPLTSQLACPRRRAAAAPTRIDVPVEREADRRRVAAAGSRTAAGRARRRVPSTSRCSRIGQLADDADRAAGDGGRERRQLRLERRGRTDRATCR